MSIKLIAFDLDGTLLDDHKQISDKTLEVLQKAADRGVILVPATGRIRGAVPEFIRNLPYTRYLITINGGVVWDTGKDYIVYQKVFNREQSLEVWDYLQQFDAMSDIYANGTGWMQPKNQEMIDTYVLIPEMRKLIRSTRNITPDVREYILHCEGVEKFNMYFKEGEKQARAKRMISEHFPFLKATTSVLNNIELNHFEADKGHGLRALCDYLGIAPEETMAFGDGDNDTSMILLAGTGVAMGNGEESLKKVADRIALTNEEDGVARMIEEVLGL